MKKKDNAVPNRQLSGERQRRGWSQAYVAAQIGTNQFTISRWESGFTFPTPHHRQKLCEFFDMSTAELGLISRSSVEYRHQLDGQPPFKQEAAIFPTEEPLYDPAIPFLSIGPTGLVGRDVMLNTLRQRLQIGKNLVLSALKGLPGVGKTALAVGLVGDSEIQKHFMHGVLWAGLGPKPNVAGLLSRWGTLLGIEPEQPTLEARQQAIRNAIGTRQILLVIDDAWDIEDALAFKVGGPNCAHLATTRFPAIAHQFADGETIEVHELDEDDSLKLLERLAPEVVNSEPDAALRLVQSAGGLPLALTLIGKYLHAQAHSGQPRRLHAALRRLQSADQRLQLAQPQAPIVSYPSLPTGTPLSLQSVIEVSDQQLDEAARQALRALSVFPAKPNSFSVTAASAVCNASMETLNALINAGLLEQSGPDRYTLHQAIADYARLQHADTNAEERVATFFVEFAEKHERDYASLEQEINNVQAALQIAFEQGMQEILVRGANACSHFLQTGGLYELAELHLKRAEQAAHSANNMVGLSTILLNLGRLAERRGNYQQAEALYDEGLTRARQVDAPDRISALLTYLGGLAARRGEHQQAEAYSREALTLARQIGQFELINTLLENLGAVAFYRGDYTQAEIYWQEALAYARKINHRERIGALLENLGALGVNRGDYAQAEAYYQEGLSLARQIGQRERISSIYSNLCEIALRREDFLQVETYAQEGLKLARQIGHREIISLLLMSLGEAATGLEHYAQAEEHLQEGLELARQVGHPWVISYALLAWGKHHLKRSQLDLAAAVFRQALETAQQANQELVAEAYYGLARVAAAQQDEDEARHQAQKSLDIFKSIGHEKKEQVARWLIELPADRLLGKSRNR